MRMWIVGVVLLIAGCNARPSAEQATGEKKPPQGPPEQKTYEVRHLPDAQIEIDGVVNESDWQKANLANDFCLPWKEETAPPTEFRALCDDEFLYFSFVVHDEDIVVEKNFKDEMGAIGEDRVELYFSPDEKLEKPYFCVEMDSRGRKLDYQARFYRDFDFSWAFPELRFAASPLEQGYVVEGSIPLRTLESLGLPSLRSGKLKVGVFRAEFSHGEGPKPVENWVSWVNPHTTEEDYHVPGTMGTFRIAK